MYFRQATGSLFFAFVAEVGDVCCSSVRFLDNTPNGFSLAPEAESEKVLGSVLIMPACSKISLAFPMAWISGRVEQASSAILIFKRAIAADVSLFVFELDTTLEVCIGKGAKIYVESARITDRKADSRSKTGASFPVAPSCLP